MLRSSSTPSLQIGNSDCGGLQWARHRFAGMLDQGILLSFLDCARRAASPPAPRVVRSDDGSAPLDQIGHASDGRYRDGHEDPGFDQPQCVDPVR